MNLRRMFAYAIARRVAYVLVAALFVLIGSLLSGEANAAPVDNKNCGQRAPWCNIGEAAARGHESLSTAPTVPNGWTETYLGCQHLVSSKRFYCRQIRTRDSDGVEQSSFLGYYYYSEGCPVGGVWDDENQTCFTCDVNAPPLGPGHFQCAGAGFDSCSYTVCVGGCGFDQPGGGHDGYVIDGRMWARTDGWMPRGETCEVGALPGLGTPPTDSDGDGTSDANDRAPNNPGDGGGADENGEGQPEDGSSPCGGPGQPACAEDGSNEGSGKGNTSGGGGNCQTPPSSTGDAILAQIAYQAWATRCAVEGQGQGGSGTGPGTGDGDGAKEGTLKGIKDWLDGNGEGVSDAEDPWMDGLPGDQSDWNLGLGGGSCPAPISTTISLGGTSAPIEFSFQPMCDLAGLLNTLFKALGALIAAYIIAGVRR